MNKFMLKEEIKILKLVINDEIEVTFRCKGGPMGKLVLFSEK